jgi:hypothetical protein
MFLFARPAGTARYICGLRAALRGTKVPCKSGKARPAGGMTSRRIIVWLLVEWLASDDSRVVADAIGLCSDATAV